MATCPCRLGSVDSVACVRLAFAERANRARARDKEVFFHFRKGVLSLFDIGLCLARKAKPRAASVVARAVNGGLGFTHSPIGRPMRASADSGRNAWPCPRLRGVLAVDVA